MTEAIEMTVNGRRERVEVEAGTPAVLAALRA